MDFYFLLGVRPDATTADIKRAYRRLARRYHPGINPGDRAAEAMFERVSEAYETLIDPDRRRHYDDVGAGSPPAASARATFTFAEFDFSVARQGSEASTFTELFADVLHPVPKAGLAESGSDLHASLTIRFVEALRGVERQVLVTRQVVCGACKGVGHVAAADGACASCQGAGQVRWARGHMVLAKSCPECGGAGRRVTLLCAVCAGEGRAVRSEPVAVRVPAGVSDGARLRIPGWGHGGRRGGAPGDLYVTVHVQPHPVFHRQGDDLLCVLPVAVHEAVLGGRIDAPTLDGRVKLRIPPGTQAGHRLRLAGGGLPTPHGAHGDLLYEIRLVLPEALDDRARELMREFGQLHGEDVRRDLFEQLDA